MAQYGVFTERQREYLSGEPVDLDDSGERAIRGDIRKRIGTAFAEFVLLDKVEKKDREQIFREKLVYTDDDHKVTAGDVDPGTAKRDPDRWEPGNPRQMQTGFVHLLQFLYTGLLERTSDRDRLLESLESDIESAIRHAELEVAESDPYGSDSFDWHVSVSIDVERVDDTGLEVAKGKLDRGEELFPAEAKALLDAGELVPASVDE